VSDSTIKAAIGVVALLGMVGIGAAACNGDGGPSCPTGYVVEYDDDGYECEPDSDGNGVDDEEDD
jgi:hypothetical protein